VVASIPSIVIRPVIGGLIVWLSLSVRLQDEKELGEPQYENPLFGSPID